VSALVYGSLCFSDIASPADLQKTSFKNLLAKFKPGQRIEVTFRKGQFYLYQPPSNFKRGDLCIARYVKQQQGHGCTVQLTRDCFGSIQYCEITDEILGAQCSWLKTKGVFLARVIDTDKNGRPRLSTRQSVLADWQLISQGATAHFQQQDQSLQAQGNLRNKLLKFGPKLSIAQNQLFLGFVSNLSKAGCFVQVGHQCTVRVGLNELSDESDFDF
jgi:predicted RNA-binding protein with RPS1 domain